MRIASIPSLVAIVALAVAPSSATAQQPDVATLLARIVQLEQAVGTLDLRLARIEQLEQTVGTLELRIAALEKAVAEAPASRMGRATELANWRQLRRRMKMDKVRELLGEPARVDANSIRITWLFVSGGTVYFDAESERVDGWQEP